MIRALSPLLALLLAAPAIAQTPARVDLGLGSIATHSVRAYGAAGDGTTNDAAAIAATPGTRFLPPGTYYMGTSLVPYVGPPMMGGITGGTLKSLERGVRRLGPRNLSVISRPPARGAGFSEDSSTTSFDADFSGAFLTGLTRITGAATLGRPATGYMGNNPASAIYLQYNNISGWNQATGSNDGRTGTSAVRVRINNSGQGDVAAFTAAGYANSRRAGATSFLANPASLLFSGSNRAGADGVYLDTMEFGIDDMGFDVAATTLVSTMRRRNATGALDAFWAGIRIQAYSLGGGGKPIDAFASYAGPARIGIDLSSASLYELDGVTPSHAAVALPAGARIYGNARNAGTGGFPNKTALGGEWIGYQPGSGWNLAVGGVPILQAAAAGVAVTRLRITAPAVPASASSPCSQGQVAYDTRFVYICVAVNSWKRAALESW